MDARMFRDEPITLKQGLLAIDLVDRMHVGARLGTLGCNFQGLLVHSAKDRADYRSAAARVCRPIGHRVRVVRPSPSLRDARRKGPR